ncbi:MAG: type II toxin-antitoxin system VapC family toxin [Candidatus Cloacimonetes bacterium]|nr:type II toxin-antitoxin system VapC family toxin [Candidatus Cloacimonadota bacterium]
MNYLLDTHTLIWFLENNPILPDIVRNNIRNPKNNVFVSMISLWEIIIKINIEKLKLHFDFDELFDAIETFSYEILPLKKEHLRVYLPLPLTHRDPFDRLLISIAKCENLKIITKDEKIRNYDVEWVWDK